MDTIQCRLLASNEFEEFTHLLDDVLASEISYDHIFLEDLRKIQPSKGSEMGVLIVPIADASSMSDVKTEVDRYRDAGAHISILGITKACNDPQATKYLSMFDSIVSMNWSTAPKLIQNFLKFQLAGLQNRAFRAYLDGSEDGYWIWSVKDDIIEWSKRTEEMTNSDIAAFPINMAIFSELIHPQDRCRVQQAIQRHLEQDASYKDVQMRIRREDGTYGNYLANGRSLRDEEDRPILLVGSLTDYSRLQSTEKKLESTQKRFTILFHQMNDAAVLADINTGLILEANLQAEGLWGRSVSELIGMHQSQLHPEELSDDARRAFSDHINALKRNKRDSIQVPIIRSDGTEIPTEISSSLIEIDNETMILGVFRDISERKKAEHEIREADAKIRMSAHLASLGTLAAGVAHEINTPLAYLLGNLEVLKSQLSINEYSNKGIHESLEGALTGCQYVREIVSDLRSISKMESNEIDCDPIEVLDLATRMAMADLRHIAQVDLRLTKVRKAMISGARLSQVILNILSNAKRAFSSKDRNTNLIKISVHEEYDRIWIVVEDNGKGISSDDLKHIWEPFFTKNGNQGGTGLGLSICKRLLEESHGSISVSSELGRGTEVQISLPAGDLCQTHHSRNVKSNSSNSNRKLRLLVIDDEPLLTNLIKRMLISDFDVTTQNCATEALEVMNGDIAFDLVLCDIMMPKMNGMEFFEAAKEDRNILFMTGGAITTSGIDFEKRMLNEGRLIYKPFSVVSLKQHLEKFIERYSENFCDNSESSIKIIQPDRNVFSELERCMGIEQLQSAYIALLDQLVYFLDTYMEIEEDTLRDETHRLAGTVETFGLFEFGQLLRNSHKAATNGRIDLVQVEIDKIRPMIAPFENFVSAYSAHGGSKPNHSEPTTGKP